MKPPPIIRATSSGVQRLVLTGGPGQVPGVDEDVIDDDHVDHLLERAAAHRAVGLPRSRLRVIERRLDRVARCWSRRAPDPRSTAAAGAKSTSEPAEEAGHPFDEMPDDVTGHPSLARRRAVPGVGGNRPHPLGELPSDLAIALSCLGRSRGHGVAFRETAGFRA